MRGVPRTARRRGNVSIPPFVSYLPKLKSLCAFLLVALGLRLPALLPDLDSKLSVHPRMVQRLARVI